MIIVMVTTSYPRFRGDTVGTFMEPIAREVAACGHEVHVVAPWHPLVRRDPIEDRVHFHFFRYAPVKGLNVFGYATALRADVDLRVTAYLAAPLALVAGWRAARHVARRVGATIMHGHWVVPGGVMAAAAAGSLPLLISLHGSDVYIAERHLFARRAARAVFRRAGWITACSEDLRERAVRLGAKPERTSVVPYGVDADRFRPDAALRSRLRTTLGLNDADPLVFSAGRLVRKKGFEYLIDAMAHLARDWPSLTLAIAGSGDLAAELKTKSAALGLAGRVRFLGDVSHDDIPGYLAAADLVVVPSVRDDTGNVDGLPNIVLEALASGTPLVATTAGGIGSVAEDGRSALLVPERDHAAIARAIDSLLRDSRRRTALGLAGRSDAVTRHTWAGVGAAFDELYGRLMSRT